MGRLISSAIISALGLYGLSYAASALNAFAAAIIFGIGKTYFWPVMLGVTAERFARDGALLHAIDAASSDTRTRERW